MIIPVISVLMPVYNSEKYLAEAIESVLNQSYTNFEFLIFDDGSTDSSKDIIKEYSKKDSRIKSFFFKENQGYVIHLNQGLEIANGKYIARMDSDDICLPNRFKIQIEYLESHPEIWVLGSSSIIINDQGEEMGKSKRFNNPDELYFMSFFINPLSHPTVFFRKKEIKSIGGYNEKKQPSEDFDLWTRVLNKGKIANIEQPLLKYREHDSSISVKKRELQKKNSHQTLRDFWKRELNIFVDDDEILFLKQFHKGYDDLPKEKAYPLFNKILATISKFKKQKALFKNYEIETFLHGSLIYLILNARHHSYIEMSIMFIKAFQLKIQLINIK